MSQLRSQQFVEFASLNDTDVSTSIDNVSSVLNAFGMDTSQAGGMLDVLNSVEQSTGLSMDTLAQDLSQNAAQLQSMGLNATQSAGFWEKLPAPMQQFIVKAALVAAAVGPVLVGIGKVTSSIGTITSGIGSVMTHLGGLSGAMTAFSSVGLLPMIGIIAAVVAAVVTVIAIIKNCGAISNWFKGVWEGVCNGVKAVETSSQGYGTA